MIKIPFGTVWTYSQIATNLHKPKASRAIGNAVARNPIAILIPCHRVICTNGHIGGYRWGQHNKINLLKWETFCSNPKLDCESEFIESHSPNINKHIDPIK